MQIPVLLVVLEYAILLALTNFCSYNQARRNIFEATGAQVMISKLQGQLQHTYWDWGGKLENFKENPTKIQEKILFSYQIVICLQFIQFLSNFKNIFNCWKLAKFVKSQNPPGHAPVAPAISPGLRMHLNF